MNRRPLHGGEYRHRHGNGEMIRDFSVNTNPLGMPDSVKSALFDADSENLFTDYPDTECSELRAALSKKLGVGEELIVCGNGAAELIYRIIAVSGFKKVLLPVPCFSEYERALEENNIDVINIDTSFKDNFTLNERELSAKGEKYSGADALIIANPANPSGAVMSADALKSVMDWCSSNSCTLIIDECFIMLSENTESVIKYLSGADDSDENGGHGNGIPEIIIIRSFTKTFALAGLRLGYAVFSSGSRAGEVSREGAPWIVSGPAQAAGLVALSDESYLKDASELISRQRKNIESALDNLNVRYYKSSANYLLLRLNSESAEDMERKGFPLRDCSDYRVLSGCGNMRYYRLAVKDAESNRRMLNALEDTLSETRRAAPLMVQGTMSNAGKSIIVTGLCRIFSQDGLSTAPFKSQNMALNSYVTLDGSEIGRAQAVQAEAAGKLPVADMNPVLLKPTADNGSQVIVNGKPLGNMPARKYYREKIRFLPDIAGAYDRLAAVNDVVVIEGAGSPVELNLNENDLVNMGMADLADAPVLLVGDIDRGGIYAQLAGTLMLLEDTHRERVRGLIVNKMRGDAGLFEEGVELLEEITGKKLLALMPYININIDAEDSLSGKFSGKLRAEGDVVIAVVRLPRISNFSDFLILEASKGISVKYVESASQLIDADMVVIPGTKSTIMDLIWMKETGVAEGVIRAASEGKPVIGICGGYQMLGRQIIDYSGAEIESGAIDGLNLLPVETFFEAFDDKRTQQVRGRIRPLDGYFAELSDIEIKGYEIHMGYTVPEGADEPFADIVDSESEQSTDGFVKENVLGTYVHGLFDNKKVTDVLLESLKKSSGKQSLPLNVPDINGFKEEQYDKLADALRSALDMESIYEILGIPYVNS